MTAVRHAEVHGVGPQRRVRERRRNGAVVQEGLLLHHSELIVAAHTQIWRAHSHHAVVGDVGELLGDNPHASHLFAPIIDGSVAPETFIIVVPVEYYIDLYSLILHQDIVHVK